MDIERGVYTLLIGVLGFFCSLMWQRYRELEDHKLVGKAVRSLREKESAIIRSSFEDDAGATTTSESAAVREGALPSSGVTTSERTTVGEEPALPSTGAASEYSNEDSTTHTETVEPNTSARHYQNRIDDFSLERVNRLLEAEVSNNLLPRIFSAPIPAL